MVAAHYSPLICVHREPGLTGAEAARRLNITPQLTTLLGQVVDAVREA
ncbi:hypothetical protein [Streptomyces sp. NPDC054834]